MPASQCDVHVLAVDDSPVDRMVIAHLLRSKKYKVTPVDSGRRALEILNMEPNVDMVITDYYMPEMRGYELLKEIKCSSWLKEIPVVIISIESSSNNINK